MVRPRGPVRRNRKQDRGIIGDDIYSDSAAGERGRTVRAGGEAGGRDIVGIRRVIGMILGAKKGARWGGTVEIRR